MRKKAKTPKMAMAGVCSKFRPAPMVVVVGTCLYLFVAGGEQCKHISTNKRGCGQTAKPKLLRRELIFFQCFFHYPLLGTIEELHPELQKPGKRRNFTVGFFSTRQKTKANPTHLTHSLT